MNVDRELNFPLCPNPECRIECRFMEGSSRTGSWIMCPNCEYCSSMAKDNATALRLHRAICGIARTQKCGPTVAEMPKLGEMLQNACDRFANGFADPEPKQDTGRDIADWICTGCGSTVDGHDVTYEEYHDPRAEGGCGGKVIPVPPPKQDAGREAVAWRLRGVWNDWLYFDSITEAEKHMISSDGPPTPLYLHPANDEAVRLLEDVYDNTYGDRCIDGDVETYCRVCNKEESKHESWCPLPKIEAFLTTKESGNG